MNKKKIVICVVIVLMVCFVVVVAWQKNRTEYTGSGITYLSEANGNSLLNVYNYRNSENYAQKMDNLSKLFWLTSTVYEDISVSVDNNSNIYVLSKNKIDIFGKVAKNIIEIHKMSKGYLLIREQNNNCYLEVWSEDFKQCLHQVNVRGSFSAAFVKNDKIVFSVYDMVTYKKTQIYSLDVKTFELKMEVQMDKAYEVYAFKPDENLYLVINEEITELNNKEINKMYSVQGDNSLQEIMQFETPIKKVEKVSGHIYGLFGNDSTEVLSIDMTERTKEEVATVDLEIPQGLYYIDDKLYIITEQGIYLKDNGLRLLQRIRNKEQVVNEFR